MKKVMGLSVILLQLLAISAYANTGGPDAFGYSWKDNLEPDGPSFSYIDITTTGTYVGQGDDSGFGPLDFGFTFPFYRTPYMQFYVNTNGLITLTELTGARLNYCPVPDESRRDFWMAPFWDDLDSATIYYQYFDSTVDFVVIQWSPFSKYQRYGDPMNMEAVLYADGKIVYQYQYINSLENSQGQTASVGIERDSTVGLTYLCNDDNPAYELHSGLAVGFYPPIINHDIAALSVDEPTIKLYMAGGAITVRATLRNEGLMADNFNAYLDVLSSGGTRVFRDTMAMYLTPGNTGIAIFSAYNLPFADSFTLIVTAGLPTDQIHDNDSTMSYVKAMDVVSLPLTQDFESGWPITGWNVLDHSGDSSTWTASTISARSPVNSAQACYDAWGAPDDWLVLPPINLAGAVEVRWQYYEDQSHWPANGLRHTLYVSTGTNFDPVTATPLVVQTPANHNINGFAGDPESVDLTPYVGNTHVWLAYRYEQNSGANWDSLDYVMEYWWIDDVRVYEVPDDDVGIYSINSPFGYIREKCDSPVEVVVQNFGRHYQEFVVNVTVTGLTNGEVYNNHINNVSLEPYASQTLTFPPLTVVAPDSYTITATAEMPWDINPSNNVMNQQFYVSTIIEHIWDDTINDQCLVASPFNNSMLAVKFTPLAQNFIILGGNIFVEDYNADPDGYAQYEWVKICPDAGGVPDIENAFATVESVGTFTVPVTIPISFNGVEVYNYLSDVWMVAKYSDTSVFFLCTGSDDSNPRGKSYYNDQGYPPVWTADTDENYMMRLDLQYNPCPRLEPQIHPSVASFFDTVPAGGIKYDTLYVNNLGLSMLSCGLHDNRPWLSVVPDTCDVPSEHRIMTIVTLDATELSQGNYTGNITINSNDPDQPLVNLPVSLIVGRGNGIYGIVYNGDNTTPLANVIITTHDATEYVVGIDTSNAAGMWDIDLPGGTYHEHLTKLGYYDGLISDIAVAGGVPTAVNFNMQLLPVGCHYIVGDANGSNIFTGLDVTYCVRYFKGGPPPPYTCECPPGGGNFWYVAGDVNGSCSFTGLDITYMVRYFKGGATPIPCASCPPIVGLEPLAKPIPAPGTIPIEMSK
ncbi:MAG TPA: hypothetical protein DCZ43_09750 [candidate division Zixibacteria bacterium]|nr:hypothetical protein [candidate division Zixibacteria bacterium]